MSRQKRVLKRRSLSKRFVVAEQHVVCSFERDPTGVAFPVDLLKKFAVPNQWKITLKIENRHFKKIGYFSTNFSHFWYKTIHLKPKNKPINSKIDSFYKKLHHFNSTRTFPDI
ncbi:hypothetical protein ACS5NO_20965 [Larkinella sp. GY13]|uniref:hypothetical protein n=1 Tax=Larkinella sp. GY13 TaxID=3453720 RepID=UPI003EED15EF